MIRQKKYPAIRKKLWGEACGAIGSGLLKRNPLALQRTDRVAGLEPNATERYGVPRAKSNDDFGHNVLLPAHASFQTGGPINRAAPKAQVSRTSCIRRGG